MRAILRTRCGCQKKVEVPDPAPRYFEVMMFPNRSALPVDLDAPTETRARMFEFIDTGYDPVLHERIAFYLERL